MKIKPRLVYHYMVAYNFPNGNGRIEILRDRRIKSYGDVESMDKIIQDHNHLKAYVYYYKLLKVELKFKEHDK